MKTPGFIFAGVFLAALVPLLSSITPDYKKPHHVTLYGNNGQILKEWHHVGFSNMGGYAYIYIENGKSVEISGTIVSEPE